MHLRARSNDNVTLFYAADKDFQFFPQGLEKLFINLNYIYFGTTNITKLEKSDLQAFGNNLRSFDFNDNKIDEIAADLFDATPNLERIFLDGNNIKKVGHGAFDKLQSLSTLVFYGNPCFSGEARKHRDGVIQLVKQIEDKCN